MKWDTMLNITEINEDRILNKIEVSGLVYRTFNGINEERKLKISKVNGTE